MLCGRIGVMKVSVIIPTYNEERNIKRLLLSIKKQTLAKEVEAIVVDDGSKDKTVEIAKKFCKKVYQRSHAERSVQRNFGATHAGGNYLMFIDADMELTPKVVESCIKNINDYGALIIPEKTVGRGFVSKIRQFERNMYIGDPSIEVARFFPKKVFQEFHGYDTELTGTEDYDLPKRISSKYKIGHADEFIYHHETGLTLKKQLYKKYYYAKLSAKYVDKHPDLVSKQGILIFRKAYFRHWKDFLFHPLLGLELLFMRSLETCAAALGFLHAVGPTVFIKTFFKMFKHL